MEANIKTHRDILGQLGVDAEFLRSLPESYRPHFLKQILRLQQRAHHPDSGGNQEDFKFIQQLAGRLGPILKGLDTALQDLVHILPIETRLRQEQAKRMNLGNSRTSLAQQRLSWLATLLPMDVEIGVQDLRSTEIVICLTTEVSEDEIVRAAKNSILRNKLKKLKLRWNETSTRIDEPHAMIFEWELSFDSDGNAVKPILPATLGKLNAAVLGSILAGSSIPTSDRISLAAQIEDPALATQLAGTRLKTLAENMLQEVSSRLGFGIEYESRSIVFLVLDEAGKACFYEGGPIISLKRDGRAPKPIRLAESDRAHRPSDLISGEHLESLCFEMIECLRLNSFSRLKARCDALAEVPDLRQRVFSNEQVRSALSERVARLLLVPGGHTKVARIAQECFGLDYVLEFPEECARALCYYLGDLRLASNNKFIAFCKELGDKLGDEIWSDKLITPFRNYIVREMKAAGGWERMYGLFNALKLPERRFHEVLELIIHDFATDDRGLKAICAVFEKVSDKAALRQRELVESKLSLMLDRYLSDDQFPKIDVQYFIRTIGWSDYDVAQEVCLRFEDREVMAGTCSNFDSSKEFLERAHVRLPLILGSAVSELHRREETCKTFRLVLETLLMAQFDISTLESWCAPLELSDELFLVARRLLEDAITRIDEDDNNLSRYLIRGFPEIVHDELSLQRARMLLGDEFKPNILNHPVIPSNITEEQG